MPPVPAQTGFFGVDEVGQVAEAAGKPEAPEAPSVSEDRQVLSAATAPSEVHQAAATDEFERTFEFAMEPAGYRPTEIESSQCQASGISQGYLSKVVSVPRRLPSRSAAESQSKSSSVELPCRRSVYRF